MGSTKEGLHYNQHSADNIVNEDATVIKEAEIADHSLYDDDFDIKEKELKNG